MLSPTDATPPLAGLGINAHIAATPDHALIVRTLVAALDDVLDLARKSKTRDGRMSGPVVERRLEQALREIGGRG